MSEYQNVEKPLLDQLSALGWQVIEQGPAFPTDSAKSLRTSFREVTLRGTFNRAVRAINLIEASGQEPDRHTAAVTPHPVKRKEPLSLPDNGSP